MYGFSASLTVRFTSSLVWVRVRSRVRVGIRVGLEFVLAHMRFGVCPVGKR